MAIHIQIQEVREAKSRLVQLNEQMSDHLVTLKQQFIQCQDSFDSEAGHEFQQRFQLLSKRFLELRDTLDRYIQFLEITTSSYESLDASLKGNVNGMQL